jgi:hypothetical protein
MALRTVTYLTDDLDGSDADETVKFALDGTEYKVDLSEKNAAALRDSLAKFVAAGRRVGKAAGRGRRSTPANRQQNKAIRDWATAKGVEVSPRGRIPQEIVDEYHARAGAAS